MSVVKMEPGQNFRIGSIFVEPARNLIKFDGGLIPLEPRIMDVLEYLARHQGSVCSRDEIISAIWKVEFGADESLTRAISMIRKAFRKAGGQGTFIQTISKRGYSLQVPVTVDSLDTRRQDYLPKPDSLQGPEPIETDAVSQTKIVHEEIIVQPPSNVSPVITAPPLVLPETGKSAENPISLQQTSKWRFMIPAIVAIGVAGLALSAGLLRSGPEDFADMDIPLGGSMAISEHGRSVAVMPFSDMSAGQDSQYFSDGLAVEILNEIGKISSLRVIAQNSEMADRNKGLTYKQMGSELAVSHIIHGAIRKQGDRVRITAQLINTVDNQRAWSANYDGTLEDIFELQQNVSRDIATELTLILDLDIEAVIELGDPLLHTLTSGGE